MPRLALAGADRAAGVGHVLLARVVNVEVYLAHVENGIRQEAVKQRHQILTLAAQQFGHQRQAVGLVEHRLALEIERDDGAALLDHQFAIAVVNIGAWVALPGGAKLCPPGHAVEDVHARPRDPPAAGRLYQPHDAPVVVDRAVHA